MNWLVWSSLDLENGVGGVETHARCLARELRKIGIEVTFSSDPAAAFDTRWDVIHTHGSGIFFKDHWRAKRWHRARASISPPAIFVQTVHGFTHQRMIPRREWNWIGAYFAILKEITALKVADVILAIHDNFPLLKKFEGPKKIIRVCSNGWDSWNDSIPVSPIEPDLLAGINALGPFWVYIGRAVDPIKGVELIQEAQKVNSQLKVIAVPGSGFSANGQSLRLGILSAEQVRSLLLMSKGLLLTSLYEGLPLVVLEALALGVPVVSTSVGGLPTLSKELQGLSLVSDRSAITLNGAVLKSELQNPMDEEVRTKRMTHNRRLLKSWADVAATSLQAVKDARLMMEPM